MKKGCGIVMRFARDPAAASGDSLCPVKKRSRIVDSSLQVPESNEKRSKYKTTDDALHYLRKVKQRLGEEKYRAFLETMVGIKAMRTDTRDGLARVKELFKGYPKLIMGLNTFMPEGYTLSPTDMFEISVNQDCDEFDDALAFITKIKMRLEGDQFVNILKAWRHGKKSYSEVLTEMTVLFTDHHDLLEEAAYFLPDSDSSMFVPAGRPTTILMTQETQSKRKNKNVVLRGRKKSALGIRDSKDTLHSANQNIVKGISEPDKCNPSYYLLSKDYPKPLASQRTKLDSQVLNDDWVCTAPGNIRHPFKNQYEEILFQCEDDRFTVDMKLQRFHAALSNVEDLLDKFNKGIIKTNVLINLEDHFTALNISCIKMLYGDSGDDIMDMLQDRPRDTLPIILERLKQRKEETTRLKAQGNQVWAAEEAKCHQRITRLKLRSVK